MPSSRLHDLKHFAWLASVPVAHRGLHGHGLVENSLGAFAAAMRAHFAIECDVHLSSDGEAIVFHDDTLERLTDAEGPLSDRTAAELTALKLKPGDDYIPRLSALLELVDGKVPLLIELKRDSKRSGNQDHRLEACVAALLDSYRGPFAIQSFDAGCVAWFARHRSDVPRGQLASKALPMEGDPNFIGYDIRNLPSPAVAAARARGLPVLAWTVRSRQDLERARAYADNVIFESIVPLKIEVLDHIGAVAATDWNRLANPPGEEHNPFLTHEFLSALEDSGCVGEGTGWTPIHLALKDGKSLIGAMPLYLKSHSYGEYVFDQSWADAFERAGGAYYPKLQSAIPFTPVTGRRLLAETDSSRRALIEGAIEVARRIEVSSLHVTFPIEAEWKALGAAGYLLRQDQQFHWFNESYRDFQDFLDQLASRKRKQIRKERETAHLAGIEIEIISGADLTESHWDAFFHFYMDTGGRKWGRPYLNRLFFSLLSERLRDAIVLIMCRRAGRWIAGALNFKGSAALFGRNWGCIEDHPFLHFETCYYQAIDYAIAHGLARVEAGAQGPHKLARGYRPSLVYSAHWIRDRNFHDAVARYLAQERRAVLHQVEAMDEHLPFRKIAAPEEEP